MSVKTVKETPLAQMLKLDDLYIGENIGRDQTLGLKGHTEDSIRRLAFSIKEVGYVIQPITIGPKGYRDDNHKETPEDKYPVLAGVGRVLSLNRLRQDNPTDSRWVAIPARVQGGMDTKQAELISLHENAVRFAPTSLGWADGMARLAYMGKTDQQVAEMYNVTPAEVSSYKLLRQLSPSLRNLLNDSETTEGIWKDAKRKDGEIADNVERAGDDKKPIKYRKLTATFAIKLVRILNQYLKATKAENMPDEDRYALLGKVEAHWDKTGEWTAKPIEDMIAKAKTPATPAPATNTETTQKGATEDVTAGEPVAPKPVAETAGTTPGNGKDNGKGRADTTGNPKPVTTTQTVREAQSNAPAKDTFNTTGGAAYIAHRLSQVDNEAAKAIAHVIANAKWTNHNGVIMPTAEDKAKFDQALAMAFPVTATATATN